MVREGNYTNPEAKVQPGGTVEAKRVDWEELLEVIPLGLFWQRSAAGRVLLNPPAGEILGINRDQLDQKEFWDWLCGLDLNPRLARERVNRALERIPAQPVITIRAAGNPKRVITATLFSLPESPGEGTGVAGWIWDGSLEWSAMMEQIGLLQELGTGIKASAAALSGNLEAVETSLKPEEPGPLRRLLEEARTQTKHINRDLDLALYLIQFLDRVPAYRQRHDALPLFTRLADEFRSTGARVVDRDGALASPIYLQADPGLLDLALDLTVREILSARAPDQHLELELAVEDSWLRIKSGSPRTLDLPGLESSPGEEGSLEGGTRLFLADRILQTFGGRLITSQDPSSTGLGLNLEIQLRLVDEQALAAPRRSTGFQAPKAGARILLAETHLEYQLAVQDALQAAGCRVALTRDGMAALDMAQSTRPDLVILSRDLPSLDGLLVAQGIRRWSDVPIILTSDRTGVDDLLHAYQLGVDEYLRVPYQVAELMARVQVWLRRWDAARSISTGEIFESDLLRIDYGLRRVWVRGEQVELTPIEYNLLEYMSRQGKQIMPYEQLLENVWHGPEKGSRQGLFVHIRRLRQKIESDPREPVIIRNQWGVGYLFTPGGSVN